MSNIPRLFFATCLLLTTCVLPRPASAQFTATPITDPAGGNTVTIRLADCGGVLFFAAGSSTTRLEPWISRGSLATTQKVAEINPTTTGSDPDEFTRVGNFVFFAANDGTNGRELWKTDLTTLATTMVKNLRPGSASSSPHALAECQGKLVFACNADPTNTGDELYVSDGTDAGTVLVMDIIPGSGDADIQRMTTINGVTYFSANGNPGSGDHLFRTDGTPAGTFKLYGNRIACYPQRYFVYNGQAYFFMQDAQSSSGYGLWRSDGTVAGTVQIKSPITDASGDGGATPPDSVAIANGLFFFRGGTHAAGYELWRSDGTQAGTYMVKDIDTGTNYGFPSYLVSYQNQVYFVADDQTYGAQIWRSDGTDAGTVLVHEIYNALPTNPPTPKRLVVLNNKLLFLQTRDAYGLEWWQTDGTVPGLSIVTDLRAGSFNGVGDGVYSSEQMVSAGQLYFVGYNSSSATGLWSLVPYIPPVKAQMVTPAAGSTFASTSATFTWDFGTGVTSYALWIGSAPGGSDIYSGNEGTNLSKTVTTLPNDGRTLYVTLHSLINGTYQSNAYTYTAWRAPQAQKAWLTSPANGSTLPTTSLPLVWNLGSGVTSCYLFVGTAPGGYDLYAGDQGTATSRTLTVPAGGGRVYVTLWSLINGAYKGNSYYFVTAPAVRAALSAPANGSTLTGNQLNLSWTQGTGVSQYYVYVGTTYGGYDIAAVNAGTATSRTITVPQTGAPVYVTLWSLINGGFQGNNYWFTTALPVSGNRPALITSPANAGTLGSATMNLAWDTGSGVTSYALWVGSTPGGYDLYSGLEGTSRTKQVVVPADGRRIYVTLHSLIGGAYQSASYWFTAATLPDGGAAQITSPTPGSTLGGATLALSWSAVAGATQYYLFVGRSPGASDLYAASEGTGTSRTVTVPTDGRPVYTTLYSLINGAWKPSSTWFAAANTGGGNKPALITSPANGSTLSGAANTFTWAGGSGVAAYALWIGSNPGGYDLWSSADGLNTSRAVNLPTDGRKLYLTLYSSIGGVWQGASYIYTAATQAAAKAALTSPANGTTFTATSQTFTWSSASGATAYALWIGRTPGGYDVYAGEEGTNLSRTVTTLPNDGSPIYVTLYSLIGGAWRSNEYIFTAWLQP